MLGETRLPLSHIQYISNSSLGVSWAVLRPCIYWHSESALYSDRLHSWGAPRFSSGMVLPQAMNIRAGSLCTCTWHNLVGCRKDTHSHTRLFQALLEKPSQNISSQVLLWKLLQNTSFHGFILLWVICLSKYQIQRNAVNKWANSHITMVPRRQWSVRRGKCLFGHSWTTNIPINCFFRVV